MALLEQYREYIQIIKNNEEQFIEEITGYDINQAMVQLNQLKDAIGIYQQDHEKLIKEIKQVGTALQINLVDLKTEKLSIEETINAIKTWVPGISINIEQMEKMEQEILLIIRLMDHLLNRINEIIKALDLDKMKESNSNQVVTSSVLNLPVCSYKPECQTCIQESDSTLTYCINKCVMCAAERKIRAKNSTIVKTVEKSKMQIITNICVNKLSPQCDFRSQELINTNDKYFFVTLTSHRDDGSNEYIIETLVKNFMSMFPNSFPARAACYVIGFTAENVPCLYGLIRYDHRGKYRISPKSTHIRNTITSMYTREKHLRQYNVKNLTKYSNKCYKTYIKDVREKYQMMASFGQIIGNTEEDLLKSA